MIIFDTPQSAVSYLSETISNALESIPADKRALWLSGGSTPIPLYEMLADKLDFSELRLGLIDERWVPETNPGSNAAMIKRSLLKNMVESKRHKSLATMYMNKKNHQEGAKLINGIYHKLFHKTQPIAILGMGLDGHTASWFPNLPNLAEITSPDCTQWVMALDASGANAETTTTRITLTGSALSKCVKAYLFITGEGKRSVFENTTACLPIHTATKLLGDRLEVIWTA